MDMTWFQQMEDTIPKDGVRTRFAPSPTGYMHVGNLRTALYTWLIAKKEGGTYILRIEDTDQERLIEGATEIIYQTLKRCGLTWDEGPDIGGPVAPYVQTERRDIYAKYAELLIEKGGAYRCFCTKDRLQSLHDSATGKNVAKYDGHCASLTQEEIDEKLAQGVPYVIRQKIPKGGTTTFVDAIFGEITVENDTLDDNVLIKSDGLPTYNFANVVDDHIMGITHVVRGSEYLSSAPKYNLLYEAFGWPIPTYIHCSPVMRDAQNKMSKRHGDPSYEDLLAQGYLSEAIVNYVALLGWSPGGEQEFFTLDELAKAFDIKGISKSPAIFDLEKLNYFNSSYIKALSPEAFYQLAEPYLRRGVHKAEIDLTLIAPLVQTRLNTLEEIPPLLDFFDTLPEYSNELYLNKKMKTDVTNSLDALQSVLPVLEQLNTWTFEGIHDALISLAASLELKNGRIMWPLRVAVSGKAATPGGAVELCQILGKEETLRRIQLGITQLS
jgi:glutamyl-tRNA synthetase